MAWVTGLAVWPANLDVAASGAKLVSAYTGHQVVAVTQYLLVEGLAAIVLAVVVIASARATRQDGAGRLGSVVALAGIGAVTVSLIECALGLLLAAADIAEDDAQRPQCERRPARPRLCTRPAPRHGVATGVGGAGARHAERLMAMAWAAEADHAGRQPQYQSRELARGER